MNDHAPARVTEDTMAANRTRKTAAAPTDVDQDADPSSDRDARTMTTNRHDAPETDMTGTHARHGRDHDEIARDDAPDRAHDANASADAGASSDANASADETHDGARAATGAGEAGPDDGAGANDADEPAAEADADAAPDAAESLRAALEDAQQEKLRLLAEFQNYRRRAAKDTLAAKRDGMADLVAALTPALHTLDLAIASTRADSATVESIAGGVELVRKSVHDALAEMDIQRVDPLGEAFEAETMDALGQFPSELPEGHVSQVVQCGWRIGDRLIKPAQVLVSNGTPPATGDESDAAGGTGDTGDAEEGRS